MLKPNYIDMGLARTMSRDLKTEVERQLLIDFNKYIQVDTNLKFDWSESCNEGKYASLLGGSLDRYSGIKLFDEEDKFVAVGWMNFIYEESENLFIVYWDYLDVQKGETLLQVKGGKGLPSHIFNRLSQVYKEKYG